MKIRILLLTLFMAVPCFADVTVIEESSGSEIRTSYSKGIVAHYIDGTITNITDVKNKKIYVLNPVQKTFFHASFKQLREFAAGSKKTPDNIPESTPVKVVTVKTGTKHIAGYPCTEYKLVIDGNYSEASACFSKEVYELIKNEVDASEAEKLMNDMDMTGSLDPMGAKIAEMEQTAGYVMEQSSASGVPGFDTLVISVSKSELDRSVFQVPAGYKPVPLNEVFGTY